MKKAVDSNEPLWLVRVQTNHWYTATDKQVVLVLVQCRIYTLWKICISYLSEEQNTFAILLLLKRENVCLNIDRAIAFLSAHILKHYCVINIHIFSRALTFYVVTRMCKGTCNICCLEISGYFSNRWNIYNFSKENVFSKCIFKLYFIDNCHDVFSHENIFFGISMLTYFSLRRIGKDNSLRKNRNRLKSVRRSNHVVGVRILRQSYPLHNADNYDFT